MKRHGENYLSMERENVTQETEIKALDVYSPLNPAAMFMIQRRQRKLGKILAGRHGGNLGKVRLLEIGCGNGQWLVEFQTIGMRADNLAGIELDPERAQAARERVAQADIRPGNAAELPWPDESFDIVFQSTVFTSVLDHDLQLKIAQEMMRVCKKDGFILWYDFAFDNPKNPNVKGVARKQVKELFSPWKTRFERVTLAPPIARRLVPVSWLAAEMTETCLPFLNTHLIAVISR